MAEIIVELPFAHELMLVPPKKRTPQGFLVRSQTPVALKSVSGEEAPLAVEITLAGHYAKLDAANKAAYYPDGAPCIRFRAHAGRLYERIGKSPVDVATFAREAGDAGNWSHGRRWGRPFSPDDYPITPGIESWMHDRKSVLGLMTPQEAYASLAPGNIRLHQNLHDRREAEARMMLESDLLAIDGVMWLHRRQRNPRLRVITTNGNVSIDVTLGAQPLWYASEFRLDDVDAARRFAAMEAEAEGLDGYGDLEDTIAVHASALVPGDNALMLANQASAMVDAILRPKGYAAMANGPGDMLLEAVAPFRGKPEGHDDACRRMENLQAFLDAATASGYFAGGGYTRERQRLAGLARRWAEIERPRLDIQAAVNDDDAFALESLSP